MTFSEKERHQVMSILLARKMRLRGNRNLLAIVKIPGERLSNHGDILSKKKEVGGLDDSLNTTQKDRGLDTIICSLFCTL